MKISNKIKELVYDANIIIDEYEDYVLKYLEINISYDEGLNLFSAGFDIYEIGGGEMNRSGVLFPIVQDISLMTTLKKLENALIDFRLVLEEDEENKIKTIGGKKYKLVSE